MNHLKDFFSKHPRFTPSFGEARRLCMGGAVKINGEVCKEFNTELKAGDVVEMRKGKDVIKEVVE